MKEKNEQNERERAMRDFPAGHAAMTRTAYGHLLWAEHEVSDVVEARHVLDRMAGREDSTWAGVGWFTLGVIRRAKIAVELLRFNLDPSGPYGAPVDFWADRPRGGLPIPFERPLEEWTPEQVEALKRFVLFGVDAGGPAGA